MERQSSVTTHMGLCILVPIHPDSAPAYLNIPGTVVPQRPAFQGIPD